MLLGSWYKTFSLVSQLSQKFEVASRLLENLSTADMSTDIQAVALHKAKNSDPFIDPCF
jgi:hypothetical protein